MTAGAEVPKNPHSLVWGELSEDAREALKWFALMAMTCDHVGKLILGDSVAGLNELGRVAFPIFAFVFGYNLAQRGEALALRRAMPRLLLVGSVSQVIWYYLIGPLPLNIMFTLALGAWLAWPELTRWRNVEEGAVIAFVAIAGLVCDYSWLGIGMVTLACRMHQLNPPVALALWAITTASMWVFNQTFWTMMALPIVALAHLWRWPVPRLRWFFYAYYPAHLGVIALLVNKT